jgi:type I restriction enzyme S subunit
MTLSTDWSVSTVSHEFEVQLGKRLDAAVNRGEHRTCINNRGVRWGRIRVEEAIQAPLTAADIRDLRLAAGDVLMCEGGEIGRSAVWTDQLPDAYFLNTLHRLRSRGRYDPHLLVAVFERWADTGELSAIVGKATLAHLTKENLLRVALPLPPSEEQARIVDALSDADQLIAILERLIAKKQAIKQGMMQQLLTGKTRLPGFTEPWAEMALGAAASVNMGQAPAGSSYNDSGQGMPLVQGNADIHQRVTVDRIWTTAPTKVCRAGDVILTVRAPVGYTAVASKDACLGRGVCSISASGDNRFLFHALVYAEPVWALYEQGSTFTAVNSDEVRKFTVPWPANQRERRAIGEALDSADEGISTLDKQLAKAKSIKQGMMQELLTGRTRLAPVEAIT